MCKALHCPGDRHVTRAAALPRLAADWKDYARRHDARMGLRQSGLVSGGAALMQPFTIANCAPHFAGDAP